MTTTRLTVTPITPKPANFLRTVESDHAYPISSFSDAALRRIGKDYGEALIAVKQRQLSIKEHV